MRAEKTIFPRSVASGGQLDEFVGVCIFSDSFCRNDAANLVVCLRTNGPLDPALLHDRLLVASPVLTDPVAQAIDSFCYGFPHGALGVCEDTARASNASEAAMVSATCAGVMTLLARIASAF